MNDLRLKLEVVVGAALLAAAIFGPVKAYQIGKSHGFVEGIEQYQHQMQLWEEHDCP